MHIVRLAFREGNTVHIVRLAFREGNTVHIVRLAFREGNTVHILGVNVRCQVSDKYDALNSIKAGERKRRGNIAGSPDVVVHSAKQVLPRN